MINYPIISKKVISTIPENIIFTTESIKHILFVSYDINESYCTYYDIYRLNIIIHLNETDRFALFTQAFYNDKQIAVKIKNKNVVHSNELIDSNKNSIYKFYILNAKIIPKLEYLIETEIDENPLNMIKI